MYLAKPMFPARAGMSRVTTRQHARPPDVPRASGDEPLDAISLACSTKCSPRERG